MTLLRNVKSILLPAAAAAFAAAAVWIFGGHQVCFFKGLIGIPCPGCGMSRAWISVFEGDARAAFFWHPLFWSVPLFVAFALFGRFRKKGAESEKLWIAVLILFSAVYALRMILFFPASAPLEFNSRAVLPKVAFFLRSFL